MKLLKPFKCSQKVSLLLLLLLADLSKAASRDSSRIVSSCKTYFRFISQPFRSAFYYVATGADAVASSNVSKWSLVKKQKNAGGEFLKGTGTYR